MARDFLSDQLRTKKIIGDNSDNSSPKLAVYSDAAASDNDGNINAGVLDNVGPDVFLFVSGTIDGKANNTPDTVTLFGGDVVVSGTLYAENQVIEVISEATGSLDVSGSINHSDGINIGDAEDGTYTDGLFTDFNSNTLLGTAVDRFNEVLKALAPSPSPDLDQFDVDTSNGISAKLSFGSSNDQSVATPAYLSVDNSAGYTSKDVNDTYSSENPAGGNYRLGIFNGTQIVNGTLNEDVINDTYTNGIVNYPDNSFGSADQGELKLFLNGNEIHSTNIASFTNNTCSYNNGTTVTIDSTSSLKPGMKVTGSGIPDNTTILSITNPTSFVLSNTTTGGNKTNSQLTFILGSGNDLNSNSSGFINLSEAIPGKFASNTEFATFKYRTGSWQVGVADQVNGRNYVQVKHVIGAAETTTGFAEWVNDNNSDALTIVTNSLAFTGSGSKHLSGVEYFTGGSARYTANVNNVYKYIYSSSPITFSVTSTPSSILSLQNQNIPNIGASETHEKVLSIDTNSVNLSLPSSRRILNGTITAGCTVPHPIKSNLSGASTQATVSQILIDDASNTSTTSFEGFDDEAFRLISTTFNSQNDVTNASNDWVSTQEIVSGNVGYEDALMVYNGRLMSTNNNSLPNNANFSSLANGPVNNPDYSQTGGNISVAQNKVYIRSFQNKTGSAVRDISYTISGNATVRPFGYNIVNNTTDIKIFYKIPGQTGWLSAADDFSYNTVTNNSGGKIGNFNSNLGADPTNYLTFGTEEVANNESILFRVDANPTWSGLLNSVQVNFGAVGNVLSSPDTDNIDVNNSGVTGKLSFGSILTKTGYSNVIANGGSTAANANSEYNITSFSNSIRRGIFDGSATITGEINEDVSSQGNNYPANAWGSGKANVGELKLEVNGVVIANATIDLTTFTTGDSLDNGTGFTGISTATVGLDNNGLPDYRKFWRIGSFRVAPAAQRNGWNYVRVIHDLDGGTTLHTTNFAEWVNSESSPLAFSNSSIDSGSFIQGTTAPNYLSGIRYFTSAKSNLSITASNIYKNVYSSSNNAINFPTSTNATVESITVNGNGVVNGTVNSSVRPLPNLDTSVVNAFDEDIEIEASYRYNFNKSIPGSLQNATLSCRVNHPLRGNLTSSPISSLSPLIYTVTDTQLALVEDFSAESYRLKEGSYNNQTDISGGSWDASQSLVGANVDHNTGLQYLDGNLVYPTQDFRNHDATAVPAINTNLVGPQNNPNYSTASGNRTFYRKFENNSGASKFGIALDIEGSNATIVPNTTPLTGNNIHVFVKLPENTPTGQSTGFMDLALPFATGQTQDNDGCLDGSLTANIVTSGTSNNATFGTVFAYPGGTINSVAVPSDSIIIKIVTGPNWAGNLDQITLTWR